MRLAFEIFCDGVLAALLNGVYQGLLVALLAGIYLKFGRGLNAATRHGALLATLLLVTILPLIHFLIGQVDFSKDATEQPEANLAQPIEITADSPPAANPTPAFEGPAVLSEPDVIPNSALGLPSTNRALAILGEGLADSFRRLSSIVFPAFRLSAWMSIGLVSCWMVVSSLLLLRLACQLRVLRSWKRFAKPAPEHLRELFRELCVELSVTRPAELLTSDQASVPIAAGFRHPVVLLPSSVLATVSIPGARQILRHEIAHLARNDDWANLLQKIAKSIFFFHPAVWRLDRQLTLEREIACDDQVLAAAADPRSYALFLTEFASRPHRRQLVAVTTAWSNKGQLKERINMILNSNRNTSPRLARARVGLVTLGAAVIALLALRAGPRVLFAQESPAPAAVESPREVSAVAHDEAILASTDSSSAQTTIRGQNGEVRISKADGTIATIEGGPRAKSGGEAGAEPAPVKARSTASKDGDDLTLERRIERLEKMVKTLLAREKGKTKGELAPGTMGTLKTPSPDVHVNVNRSVEKELKYSKLNDEEMARIMERAKADMDRGRHEAERAINEAQRAIAESGLASHGDRLDGLTRQTLEAQRHALEAQHSALEKQMRSLERQISRLEKGQEKIEKEGERQKHAKADVDGDRDSNKAETSEGNHNKNRN